MAKLLLLDIETSPILGYTWGTYQTDVLHIVEDWKILSFACKQVGAGKKIQAETLLDYDMDEFTLVVALSTVLEDVDAVIAHNGKKFDMKKIRAKMIEHKLNPPPPVPVIDTLLEARQSFAFSKNRLDHIGQLLVNDRKQDTGGFKLWLDCMAGCPKAFAKMRKYNIQDVKLLEKVYLEMRPWMRNHPNLSIIDDTKKAACDKCCSTDLTAWGFYNTNSGKYKRFFCNGCGGWVKGAKSVLDPKTKAVGTRAAK